MIDIIEFLKSNSDWMKDISTVLFTATGTIVAILSYKRAKSTIFQPKRTEVTKIQTEILVGFLSEFTVYGNSLDKAIDYPKLLQYNIDLVLRDYDLVTDIDVKSNRYLMMDKNISGWYSNAGDIYNVNFIDGSLSDYDKVNFHDYVIKNNIENIKKGDVNIERIFVTKKHLHFVHRLRDLSNNPFLPKEIKEVANQIGKNLTINIHQKLKEIIEDQILEIYKSREDTSNFNYENITMKLKYSVIIFLFNIQRIKHEQDYELLVKKIREYLMIDKKW